MHKKLFSYIGIVSLAAALVAPVAFAQTPAPDASPLPEEALGLFKPDSAFYAVQQLGERIRLFLSINPLKRAEYELRLLERRAEEIRYLAEKSRLTVERAEKIQQQISELIENARDKIESASGRGIDVARLTEQMQEILTRQQSVLQDVASRVPTAAQDAIRRAIEASRTGKERVLELLQRLNTPLPSPSPRVSPVPSPRITPPGLQTPRPTPPRATPSPVVTPSPSPQTLNVTIEADDRGLYPETVTVPKGAIVNLLFKVRSTNVYYGGLDFRSSKFMTPAIPPGGSNGVTFVASETFTYTSYWPSSGVRKATGTIIVQ